jgi:hypothetical protein
MTMMMADEKGNNDLLGPPTHPPGAFSSSHRSGGADPPREGHERMPFPAVDACGRLLGRAFARAPRLKKDPLPPCPEARGGRRTGL